MGWCLVPVQDVYSRGCLGWWLVPMEDVYGRRCIGWCLVPIEDVYSRRCIGRASFLSRMYMAGYSPVLGLGEGCVHRQRVGLWPEPGQGQRWRRCRGAGEPAQTRGAFRRVQAGVSHPVAAVRCRLRHRPAPMPALRAQWHVPVSSRSHLCCGSLGSPGDHGVSSLSDFSPAGWDWWSPQPQGSCCPPQNTIPCPDGWGPAPGCLWLGSMEVPGHVEDAAGLLRDLKQWGDACPCLDGACPRWR